MNLYCDNYKGTVTHNLFCLAKIQSYWKVLFWFSCLNAHKVIIHKSRGEVFLVEQDIIDYVSTAYFEPKEVRKLIIFYFAHENMEKLPSKVAHNRSNFFFQYCQPTGPKPAQISNSVPWKLLTARLMYNDFEYPKHLIMWCCCLTIYFET